MFLLVKHHGNNVRNNGLKYPKTAQEGYFMNSALFINRHYSYYNLRILNRLEGNMNS